MKPNHNCNICLGIFPEYLVNNKICLICKNRIEVEKELSAERKKNLDLQDKILILEARLEMLNRPRKLRATP